MADEVQEEAPEFSKVIIGLIIAVLVLGGIVYAGYTYSQRQTGKTTLPNGYVQNNPPQTTGEIDCAKPRNSNVNIWDYYSKCDQLSVKPDAKWVIYKDPAYQFEFNIPEGAPVQKFTNGLGLAYKEFDPTINLIYSYDFAANRGGIFKTMTGKTYVENYWKQYPGLTGIKTLEPIVNGKGIKGWKAVYLIGNKEGNTEIFFELGESTGNYVHFTKGILSQPVFDNIIGTFTPSAPEPAVQGAKTQISPPQQATSSPQPQLPR